ncbi:hypothetical protein SLEP1_g18935 [Rubroshorea leprosula]|uniref:Uncharacterized protein n=1 Tax=Rubroshorea leprosula TaxID=152421 RepID=A0AAV5JB02_9ROSI|nr:hypothetical protein SLEP1_g18935 [Rubroshorea leprosula]
MMPRLLDGFDEVVVGDVPEPKASRKCVVGKGGLGDVAVARDKVVIGGDVVDVDKGKGIWEKGETPRSTWGGKLRIKGGNFGNLWREVKISTTG